MTAAVHRDSAARLDAVVAGTALVAGAALLWRVRGYVHDDAFITLRYVRRCLDGGGLTWSDGDRVEGFSHPLWALQLLALGASGMTLSTALRALGLAWIFALLAWCSSHRDRRRVLPLLAVHPGVLLWAGGGLETVCFTALLAVGAWWAATLIEPANRRQCAGLGATLGALALVRPDGFAAWGVLLAGAAWTLRRNRRGVLALVALAALPPLAWTAFRVGYYGDLLPNTAYAKLGAGATAVRLVMGHVYLEYYAGYWLPAVALFAAAFLAAGTRRREAWPALAALPLLAGTVAGGGDHMPAGRMLVPVVGLLAVATGLLARAIEGRRAGALRVAVVLTAGYWTALGWTALPTHDPSVRAGSAVGEFLQQHLAEGSLVMTATAGSTPYHAPRLRFVDPLGLNDRTVARRAVTEYVTELQNLPGHARGDGAYVLRRAPDVAVLGPTLGYPGANPRQFFLTDYELLGSVEFRRRYELWVFPVPLAEPSEVATLYAYLRSDSAAARGLAVHGRRLRAPWE